MFADLHTHTKLCNHADGEPAEYLRAAKEKGVAVYGISDHFPAPAGYDLANRMMALEYPQYTAIVAAMQELGKTLGIEVLYGAEFDYVPGRMREVYDAIRPEKFDYTIGSIHYVDDFPYDDPDEISGWEKRGVDNVWNRYVELLCEFVNGYEFDIIGHIDLPKKFGHRPGNPGLINEKLRSILEIAAARGIMMEINTAGLRRPVKEMHPSSELLSIAHEAGVEITFGSDAHAPDQVAFSFDIAKEAAKRAGYRCAWAFRQGKPFEIPFD